MPNMHGSPSQWLRNTFLKFFPLFPIHSRALARLIGRVFYGRQMDESCQQFYPTQTSVSPPVYGNERHAPGGQICANTYVQFVTQWAEFGRSGARQTERTMKTNWLPTWNNAHRLQSVSNWQQFTELPEKAATDVRFYQNQCGQEGMYVRPIWYTSEQFQTLLSCLRSCWIGMAVSNHVM